MNGRKQAMAAIGVFAVAMTACSGGASPSAGRSRGSPSPIGSVSTPTPSFSPSPTPSPTRKPLTKQDLQKVVLSNGDLKGRWLRGSSRGTFGVCGMDFPIEASTAQARIQLVDQRRSKIVFEAVMAFAPGDAVAIFGDMGGLMEACGSGRVKVIEPGPGGGTITWRHSALRVPVLADDSAGVRRTCKAIWKSQHLVEPLDLVHAEGAVAKGARFGKGAGR